MKTQKFMLGDIPALLWGENSDKIYVYVHGKMSRKEYAENFAVIAESKGCQTLSFDLPEHGERTDSERCDVWNGVADLKLISDYAFANWERIALYACSIGAYFSLNAYNTMPFEKALFQSPIVDMERLVKNMMLWSGVTEAELKDKGEIPSPVDTLRWDYYQYIISHPVTQWSIPTPYFTAERITCSPRSPSAPLRRDSAVRSLCPKTASIRLWHSPMPR